MYIYTPVYIHNCYYISLYVVSRCMVIVMGFLLLWLRRCIYCLTLRPSWYVSLLYYHQNTHMLPYMLLTLFQLCLWIIADCTFIVIYLLNIWRDFFKLWWVLVQFALQSTLQRITFKCASCEYNIVSAVILFGCQRST